jgi:hypothetical protein
VLFGFFVPTVTVLVRCFVVVMSSSSVLCSGGEMMFDGRMFCRGHNINPLLMKMRSRNVVRLLTV